MKKLVITSLVLIALLAGCAVHEKTNALIAQSNTDRFTAFTQGMNSATTEGARIAISMAFASGMGMQSFYKEDSVADYMRAGLPYANLLMPLIGGAFDYKEDSPTYELDGIGNTMWVTNEKDSRNSRQEDSGNSFSYSPIDSNTSTVDQAF